MSINSSRPQHTGNVLANSWRWEYNQNRRVFINKPRYPLGRRHWQSMGQILSSDNHHLLTITSIEARNSLVMPRFHVLADLSYSVAHAATRLPKEISNEAII